VLGRRIRQSSQVVLAGLEERDTLSEEERGVPRRDRIVQQAPVRASCSSKCLNSFRFLE